MYLWKKNAGQAGDTSGSLVRLFDRIVERSLGYRDARAKYTMLREIPVRLREHATNKEHDIDTAKAQIAALERQSLVADGIEPLEARAETAHTAMVSAEQAVAKITADLGKIEANANGSSSPTTRRAKAAPWICSRKRSSAKSCASFIARR